MPTPIGVNNAQTTFGAAHSIGATTIAMASGYGATLAGKLTALGLTLDASNPLRVTAIKRTALNAYGQITDTTQLTIFEATGRSGDTLTGVTVVEGTTDQAFALGDTLAFLWTAGMLATMRGTITTDHGGLSGLSDDDHAQYAKLTWRSGDVMTALGGADATVYLALNASPNGSNRNDYAGTVGWSFIPSASLTVTHLGRHYGQGNVSNHQVGIWEEPSGTLVASGTVLQASASEFGYKYVSITPVVLSPAKTYSVGSLEASGGDIWSHFWSAASAVSPRVTFTGYRYDNAGGTLAWPSNSGPGLNSLGAATFKFTSDESSPTIEVGFDSDTVARLGSRSTGDVVIRPKKPSRAVGIASRAVIGGSEAADTEAVLGVLGLTTIRTGEAKHLALIGKTQTFTISQSVNNPHTVGPGIQFQSNSTHLFSTSALWLGLNYFGGAPVAIGTGIPSAQCHVFTTSASRVALGIRAAASQTANLLTLANSAGTVQFAIAANGRDFVFDATTGSILGTSASQKFAFWGATPVVQPTAVADATDAASVITQLNALLARLRTIGIIAT